MTRLGLPTAGGKTLPAGTRVDAREWPNKQTLVMTGYLRPLTAEEVQPPAAARPIRGKG